MRLFKSEIVEWVLAALKIPDDQPIEDKRVSRSIASAQTAMESQNFETRKNILKYDDVMNRQRHVVYADRRRVLEGADVSAQLRSATKVVVEAYVRNATSGIEEEWNLEQLVADLNKLYPVGVDISLPEVEDADVEELVELFTADAERAYDAREEALGADVMRHVERQVLLTVLDRKWREHLYEMDYLREGIGLRAMAQRDPLVEYQREGGDMFNNMMEAMMEEVVGFLFNVEVQQVPAPQVGVVAGSDGQAVTGAGIGQAAKRVLSGPDPDGPGIEVEPDGATPGHGDASADDGPATTALRRGVALASAPEESEPAPEAAAFTVKGAATATAARPRPVRLSGPGGEQADRPATDDDPFAKVGRNQLCPCGSGKKFKNCHGRRAAAS